jgi:Leucine-rich repeat (LRR) protein
MSAGKTYTVKFKYKYLSANYSGQHPIALNISKNGSATTLSSSTFATDNNWTVKETTFTPDQNLSYDLSIYLFTFDAAFNVLIDDVQVYVQGTEQYTLIPDVNFEKKLIALGIDSGATDGKVLTNSVNKLTSLNVSSSSIANLTGIQDFVSLTYLDCSSNQITTLDVPKSDALTYLNCSYNQLTVLDVSGNLALKTLWCYNNKLTALDVSKNLVLTDFACLKNQLTALDVSKNQALKTLECYNNPLTALDVSKNVALNNLSCSNNKLTTLDVSKNVALTDFTCGTNQLTTLDVSANVALINFYCGANQLTTLDVSKNVALTDFACNNNKLTTLDISKNVVLLYLQCRENQLTALDVSKNVSLKDFNCSGNKITSLDISKNPLINELACENNQLTYLNLKNGANTILDLSFSNFVNNPNLKCIQVDDVDYSNQNWSNIKDVTATYSSTCSKLGIEDSVFDKAIISPNPTKSELHIDNIVLKKATVYDALGKLVKTTAFTSGAKDNTIHLEGLHKGIYYLYLDSEGTNTAKKIIIE